MRDKFKPQFKLNLVEIINFAKTKFNQNLNGISINLPFISFSIKVDELESNIAREILIRLEDKRVLTAFECCDDCIKSSIDSIQNIRKFLVDKQVQLSHKQDSPLFILIKLQTEAIRQFLTFEENLVINRDQYAIRQRYFEALEMLRAHLIRCLNEISKIAKIKLPAKYLYYDINWQLDVYENP